MIFGRVPYHQVMNNYASFMLPSVPTTNNNETNESVPVVTTNANPIIVSQSQTTLLPTSSAVRTSSLSHSNDISHQSLSTLPPTTQTTHNSTPGVVLLHHEDTKNYVLETYCSPINGSYTDSVPAPQHVCNFIRECVITKTKIFSCGVKLPNLSATVFKNNINTTKKFKYGIVDTRLVSCFNKSCKNSNTKLPKRFHYACYQHMITTQANDEMKMIEYEGVSDNILEQVVGVNNIKDIQQHMENNTTNKLIFPVCGKRCFNTIMANKIKSKPKSVSEYSNNKCWDTDGNELNRSSIKVLLDWITTEENASSYFGGVDKKGDTSAMRKEAYHHHIRDLIKKENGKLK